MNLNDKFTFGKYKDKTLNEIIDEDPQYVVWACNKKIITLNNKDHKKLMYAYNDSFASDEEYYIGCPEQN